MILGCIAVRETTYKKENSLSADLVDGSAMHTINKSHWRILYEA
jgi:hypothetical protein